MSLLKITLKFSIDNGYCERRTFRPQIYGEKIEIIQTCCEAFKEAIKYDYIGFDNDTYHTTYFPLSIKKSTSYPEGYDEDFMPIEYCPFCGEKIIIELEEIFLGLSENLLKHNNRKSKFLKCINEILLRIRVQAIKDRKSESMFIYKYSMNKIVYSEVFK